MLQTPAARRYAKALLELAQEQKVEEAIGGQLSQIVTALADPAVARVMGLPTLPLKLRRDVVEQLATTLSFHPLLGDFLRVLAENDRLNMLGEIHSAYQSLLEKAMGKIRVRIRSAAPLSGEELRSLVNAFSHLTKKTVIPTVEIEPDLLGGVVAEVEGRVYDASIKTQIRRMSEALAQQI
jgi:F-type H+-transporting ATPase subunit delta